VPTRPEDRKTHRTLRGRAGLAVPPRKRTARSPPSLS